MGRVVDMGALMLENENTRAVGNMNVNARGDVLDSGNRVVETKNRQVAKHYQRQVAASANHLPTTSTQAAKKQQSQRKAAKEKVAKDTSGPANPRAVKVVNEAVLDVYNDERLVSKYDKIQAAESEDDTVPDIESMDELAEFEADIPELTQDPVALPEKVAVPRGGLAAAIARTQSVKQELMKTPRQLAQNKPGVNKI
jgi:hypothetical protein